MLDDDQRCPLGEALVPTPPLPSPTSTACPLLHLVPLQGTMQCTGVAAATAAVTQAGQLVYQQAFGLRDTAQSIPADNSTIFQARAAQKRWG